MKKCFPSLPLWSWRFSTQSQNCPKKKIISKHSREPEVFKKASRKSFFFFFLNLNWIQFCFLFYKLDGTPRNALISPRILDWLVTWARSLLQNTPKQTIIVVKRTTIAASTSMLVLGSRSSHSDSSELFVSLTGSMRWGKKENTVRTRAALARERGELQRSVNNGKVGREKPGAVEVGAGHLGRQHALSRESHSSPRKQQWKQPNEAWVLSNFSWCLLWGWTSQARVRETV